MYEPVLSSKALGAFLGLTKKKQKQLSKILYQLGSYPSQVGDYSFQDDTGRDVQYILLGDYVISFWADHAMKEMRIVEIDLV